MTGLRPSLLFKAMKKRTLSIFVDESGILNESERISRYYILTLLLHDQDFKIDKFVRELDRSLDSVGIAPCERRFFGGEKKFIHDILRRMKAKEI